MSLNFRKGGEGAQRALVWSHDSPGFECELYHFLTV